MSAHRTMLAMAALLACAVLALLLGLLLVSGAREPASPPAESASAVPVPPRPRPPAAPSIERPVPVESAAAPAPVPDPAGTFRLEGSALFEDGTPCPGVHFVEMVRGEDGEPEALLESALDLRIESGADGAFTLRWPARPESILLLVMSREAEVVSVEGGATVGPHASGTVVSVAIPGPLALRMRWRPGYGLVRARSAVTGEVIPPRGIKVGDPDGGTGLVVRWKSEAWESMVWDPLKGDGSPEGWVPVRPPQARGAILEVLAEDHAAARIPLAEIRGRIEVTLLPLVPDVTGEISVPGAPGREFIVGWELLPAAAGGGPPLEVRGRIAGEGPFALSGVPDGSWALEVWAPTKEGVRWGRRAFEKSGGPVDVGRVEVATWSGFRVRCLDPDGKPLFLPVAHFRDSGGSLPGRDVLNRSVRMGNPREGADPDGWTEIPGCLPGARYRIAFMGPPDASTAADAPAATGEFLPVEIRVKTRPARCVLRFTVGGAVPASWGKWRGGNLDASGWREDGLLDVRLYPGNYFVAVEAKASEGAALRMVQANFAVPEGEVFETTVDLR